MISNWKNPPRGIAYRVLTSVIIVEKNTKLKFKVGSYPNILAMSSFTVENAVATTFPDGSLTLFDGTNLRNERLRDLWKGERRSSKSHSNAIGCCRELY